MGFLVKFVDKYKRKYNDVKLIFDFMDYWRETMLIGKIKFLHLFDFWWLMREENIKYADCVIIECDLYRKVFFKMHWKELNIKLYIKKKSEVEIDRNTLLSK